MKPLVFSEKSLADLQGILEYTARDKPLAAFGFVEKLQAECEILAHFPEIGMSREDLAPRLRLFTFRGYGIYFRNLDIELRIERVLHPSLDVRKQAFN